MRSIIPLFLLACLLNPYLSNADVPDECYNAMELVPPVVYSEQIENSFTVRDQDYYRVRVPSDKTLIISAQPDCDLDLFVDFYQNSCANHQGTKDRVSYGGFENNFVRLTNASTFTFIMDIWGKIDKPQPDAFSNYDIALEFVDREAPLAVLDIDHCDYGWDQWFTVNASFYNYTGTDKVIDIYILLCYQGEYYFWPNFTLWPDALTGVTLEHGQPFRVQAMEFQIPKGYPRVGPIFFYAAAYDETTGLWSNISWSRCSLGW